MLRARTVMIAACLAPTPALAQVLDFTRFDYPGSTITTVTGIRGNNMTGNFSMTGGATGGLLYTLPSLTPAPYPTATSSGVNFPGATTATPYGPSFGSASGILRVVGSYKTAANGDGNLGYLYDGANAPGQQLTTLALPGAFNTIAHSNFGNQVVGNWDTPPTSPPARPSSTTSRPTASPASTARAPTPARRPTASMATASPAAPASVRACRAPTSSTRAPASTRTTTRRTGARARSSRISRASPAAGAPTPTTWWPIRSIPPAPMPGSSISTRRGRRRGPSSPCRAAA